MKPYAELSYQGRVRRMRELAQAALDVYGLPDATYELLRWAGNTLFRVRAPRPGDAPAGSLFEPGQYLLRIHEPGYQAPEAIELELAWLAAMRRDADLPVPEPVPARDGSLLGSISVPGIPDARAVSLLRWVKGRSALRRVGPRHLRAQGRLMARMHAFATAWPAPPCPGKRRFDWDGLFSVDAGSGMPNAEAWALLPPGNRRAFEAVARRVREAMDAWGESRDVFGLIHGDLGVDANLLFWRGEPRAIDFDDSGFGYWIYDLAVALEFCWSSATFPQSRDALLEGYRDIRPLPTGQAEQIELFIAATEVYWNLWAAGGTHLYPEFLPTYRERMERTSEMVVRFAGRG